jgi:hypothetical protein
MALQRLTVAAYWRNYCAAQFCDTHIAWLDHYDSEVVTVQQSGISAKLYRVQFSDDSTTVVEHTAICVVQRVPGTLRNW